MSNTTPTTTRQSHTAPTVTHRALSETKAALKTTEFYAWILVSAAILIAAAVTDNGDDGQGFGAAQAWMYVAIITVAYILSRGIAKSGTHARNRDDD